MDFIFTMMKKSMRNDRLQRAGGWCKPVAAYAEVGFGVTGLNVNRRQLRFDPVGQAACPHR